VLKVTFWNAYNPWNIGAGCWYRIAPVRAATKMDPPSALETTRLQGAVAVSENISIKVPE
jgi:hypothetical protein